MVESLALWKNMITKPTKICEKILKNLFLSRKKSSSIPVTDICFNSFPANYFLKNWRVMVIFIKNNPFHVFVKVKSYFPQRKKVG